MRNIFKKNYKRKAIVLDIPLYFENNLNKKNDIVIFISSKKKLINKALKKGKNQIKTFKKIIKITKVSCY